VSPGPRRRIPTLYLPVNKRVEFVLTSRRHPLVLGAGVPAEARHDPRPRQPLPGHPTQEGTFKGKCAELCGAYHSNMLFNVKVVSQAEYDKHINDLRAAGQTGMLNNTISRGDRPLTRRPGRRHRRR
jgi:cytochrome c oxidase subunit 2